jgi:hypothetical protein
MWGAGQKHRWIIRKQRSGRPHHDIGKFVFLNPVPDIEQEPSTWLQHAMGFGKGPPLVREEHHAKLAHHRVELAIGKR